ncbi:MAG: sigma-70 family RNA polymerase sigma factor [Chloroflexota bacterium]|nr:sigma-70 family RNA polymerase sigma factor [Chloroflexota bacterium]
MDDEQGGGRRGDAAEDLILRTIAAHADSLLRTARRFSICPDDAQDAYQRSLEIFMAHAQRLDAAHAAGWLHVVVKREAQAIRRSRQKLVPSDEINLDEHEAHSLPTPEERLATFDLIGRSAEALQRLKPQELRALWLRAQGHSYNDIGAMTGWSYTKVNRCLTEGRRSFLMRYATIESGAECDRWLPIISAMVDSEATPEQVMDLRPHLRNCPGCRATLRTLQESSDPLAAILPIPLAVVAPGSGEHVSNFLMRLYEMVAGGVHDRAAASLVKAQSVLEVSAAGKAAAIAGAAAAVAGGGYATVDQRLGSTGADRPVKAQSPIPRISTAERSPTTTQPSPTTKSAVAGRPRVPLRTDVTKATREHRREFLSVSRPKAQAVAPEFGGNHEQFGSAAQGRQPQVTSPRRAPSRPSAAPEFVSPTQSSKAPEFAP